MEEPKNLNNPPINQPAETAAPKSIPTLAGAMIVLIVAVLVGAGVFYFIQTDPVVNYSSNTVIPSKSLKAKTETVEVKETAETVSETPTETADAATETVAGETFNFDYELKKLDDQNNSISADDFDENEMSDANIGL